MLAVAEVLWCVTMAWHEVAVVGHVAGYGGTRAWWCTVRCSWVGWRRQLCRDVCREALLCWMLTGYVCASVCLVGAPFLPTCENAVAFRKTLS